MQDLRRVDTSEPGYTRRRRGRGFEYFDAGGRKLTDPHELERLRALVIPPAWQEVWICADPRGHLQAVGVDAAGRRQYLYHPRWRERRDMEKFDEMLAFARRLPSLRERCRRLLVANDELSRERVLSCAIRLLDYGFFRVGGEEYAQENDTFGLATIRKEHVTLIGGVVIFDYPAKGGKQRLQSIVDPEVFEVVTRLKRRRSGGDELLAYREAGAWRDVTSREVNDFLKELAGDEFSAKDFRTWSATVLAAVGLAVSAPAASSPTAAKRAIGRTVAEVASYLGNTPAVARKSYIDPRVFDRYESGWTIAGALGQLGDEIAPGAPSVQGRVEEAVLDLLEGRVDSEAVQRIAS